MTTASVDLAGLAETLLDQLDVRWRRHDLTFSVNVYHDSLVLSIAPVERLRKYRYVLKHRLFVGELLALEREGGLEDLIAAILRSADRFSLVVAA